MLDAILAILAKITPDSWAGRVLGGILAAVAGSAFFWFVRKSRPYVYGTEEYRNRLEAQRREDAAAKQNNEVVYSCEVNGTQLKLFSGDITRSSAQIIVSSDDTLLSATGGVAKAIVQAAGRNIRRRLNTIAATNIPRGALAITDGGSTKFRYIFHAVVLTKARDHTEYPSRSEIATLLKRIVEVADATGVESIALPVLAGGTAAKKLRDEGLSTEQHVISFIISSLAGVLQGNRNALKTVFLIVFDNKHLTKDFIQELHEGEGVRVPG